MKTLSIVNKLGFSKGQAEAISGVVIGAVLLFVGLFMISAVSSATPESTLKDYGYTTATNSTNSGWINTTNNGTQALTIGDIVAISGESSTKTLSVKAENTDTSNRTFTVYLNDVSLGTLIAVKEINTTKIFTDVDWVANTVNNLTYGNTINVGTDVSVIEALGKYPSSKVDSDWGSTNTSIISTVGTIFSVLGLVLIVVALAIAIGALKGTIIGGRPIA